MPLVLERPEVLEVFAEAAERRWVLPTFNAENPTTSEAILAAALDHGRELGVERLPIIVGITVQYPPRPQAVYYTRTGQWQIGLRRFLSDLRALASRRSPFGKLRVLVHLDHVQADLEEEFLRTDLSGVSAIMYDASMLPWEENLRRTADFVEAQGRSVLVEGACDEITEAGEDASDDLTTPEQAEDYAHETGVDLLVANVGTEHRASAAVPVLHEERAREITARIGPRLCLHGTSSVAFDRLGGLYELGIRKANVWTALERDSTPELVRDVLENAARFVGPERARELHAAGLLGDRADRTSPPSLDFFSTTHRQEIVFERMKAVVRAFLEQWYV